jgi:hypothetical protein
MGLPVQFATLASGNQPLSLLDTQFAAVGAIGVIPCAAAGQNSILLTPNSNTPTINSYTDLAPSFSFVGAQTSSAAINISVAGIGARNAYKWNGQQVMGAGDIVAGGVYKATFLMALNGGSGGFVIDSVGVSNNFSDIEYVIAGGGVAITTGIKGYLRVPWAATIASWGVMGDQTGSISIDILRLNNGVPIASMIGGGTKPNLSAQQANLAVAPSGWSSTSLVQNDWIAFNVTSAATVTQVTIDLALAKL